MTRWGTLTRNLVDRLRGKSVFDSAFYRESEVTRLNNLFAHVDLEQWRDARLLEVGAGFGRLGDAFVQLGFDVTATDGRPEYVQRMISRGRQAHVLDLDQSTPEAFEGYDVVLAFGVLYHLSQPRKFLESCGPTVKAVWLESVVSDSLEPIVSDQREAMGWRGKDQALAGRGCRPSPSWVESTSKDVGFDSVRDISSPLANWSTASYDWKACNDGSWRRQGKNLRKMWILESPRARGN
ncbi:MAG: class I SAM-dependent methyltransferase [Thermoanaerobaculia bacterium]|nr:class I SAM-dependent methyltransferase [Thermoanaerobaculia bacterium]